MQSYKLVTLNDNGLAEMPLDLYNSCKTIVAMEELISEQQLLNVTPFINIDRQTFDLLVEWYKCYQPIDYTTYEMELNFEDTLPERELKFYQELSVSDVLRLHHISKYLDFQSQHPAATYPHLKQPQLTISTKLYLMKLWTKPFNSKELWEKALNVPPHWIIPYELTQPEWF
jgi:hypothetical protein